jgi:hypothetical protein
LPPTGDLSLWGPSAGSPPDNGRDRHQGVAAPALADVSAMPIASAKVALVMETQLLRTFATVAETGSISAAAARLGYVHRLPRRAVDHAVQAREPSA